MTTLRRPAKVLAAISLATATAAAALAAGSAPGGAQASAPQVTLDPATDLVDGTRVTVTATGFPPNGTIDVLQCPASSPEGALGGCDFSDSKNAMTDASGSASVELTVDAMLAGSQTEETGPPPELDCRQVGACVVRVFGGFGDPTGANTAEAPLAFDPDAPLAPPPTVTVDPSEGLTDGQSITVAVDGIVWSDSAVAILCRAGVTSSNDCDFGTFSFFTVDADGSGSTQLTASAVLDVGGTAVDCREPGACVALVTPDSGRSARKTGTAPLAFDPDTEVVVPTLTVAPDHDLVDGQTVTATGSGFGGNFVELWQCPPDAADGSCELIDFADTTGPGGSFTLGVQLSAIVFGDTGPAVDCRRSAEPCQLVATPGSVTSAHAGRAPLAFSPDGPLVPGPTVTLDPASGLPEQSTVTVTGSGFTPERFANLRVCRVGDSSLCDPETETTVDPDNHGAFTLRLGVAATFTTNAGPATEVDCRAAPGCEVVAFDFSGLRTRRGSAPLGFAPAPAPGETRYLDPVFDDVDVTMNVAYRTTTDATGQPVTLTADIYQPSGDTADQRPALVWFRGGWFAPPEFNDVAPAYAQEFARRGYVVVVMDYRQRPGLHCCPADDAPGLTASFLDAYGDAAAGVAWLRSHAADYRIDTRAIAAAGSQAGGATALHLADLPGQLGVTGSPSVAAAVGIGSVDLGRHDAGEAPTLALNSTASTPAPSFLAEWACGHSRRVGVVCETAAYDGVSSDVADVRQRDVTRRTSRFLVDAMLAPLGLAAPTGDTLTPVSSPTPAPAASASTAANGGTTTTSSAQAHGTLPQTGANATASLLRVGLVLAAVGVVLVALARARRRSDAGRLGLTGAVAVVISAVVVASLIATACSKSSDDKTDTADQTTVHDMNAPGHDMEDMDSAETGDEQGAGGHDAGGHDAGGHDADGHDADESAAGDMDGHGHGGTGGTGTGSGGGDGHGTGGHGTGTGTGGHGTGSGGHESSGHTGTGGSHDPADPGHNPGDPGHIDPGHDPADPGHNNTGDPGGHGHPQEPMPTGFDPNWTPQQTAFAQSLVDRTTAAMPQFANPAILPLMGYVWIFDGLEPGTYQHWIHTSRIVDSHTLDPQFPESLVFRNTGDLPVLEAAMYMLGLGADLNHLPADSAFLPGWHVHTNLCFDNSFRLVGVTVNGVCERGHLTPTPPMVHVWIVDTMCGRFAGVDENGLQCTSHEHDDG
jgi:acetyl esterase/lipase